MVREARAFARARGRVEILRRGRIVMEKLTALLRAVQEERHEQGRVTFVVDSTYAINMATGRTVPAQRRKSSNFGLAPL